MMNKKYFPFFFVFLLTATALFAQQPARIATTEELYKTFSKPDDRYRPFVRWWWNGNRVDSAELVRELRILKDAGIGGVEINPVEFPARTDSLGIPALDWLSDPWIDMLRVTFNEAERLGLTCDLIVGSGWPFGGEFLPEKDRSTILVNYTKTYEGPCEVVLSEDSIFKLATPKVNSAYAGRSFSLMNLQLIPSPCHDLSQTQGLLAMRNADGLYHIDVPKGRFTLSALVTIQGFMQVMNGAPGANGPVVDHYNLAAVRDYFNRMSSTIENKLGKPLSRYLRAMFIDSFELEGANWNDRFADDFEKHYGYDVRNYLPFFLRKTRGMGDPENYNDPVDVGDAQRDTVERVRYDFERLKALKLLDLLDLYSSWCHKQGVKSRAQSYGRNLFPLESSLHVDIPECESWTMTWTRHKLGEEMSELDYRKGRAYTMVNKYVSSAAHLADKPIVSCEEMTNTYTVFNMTLQLLKIGGDQSAISGVTHSVFHGFNYSPEQAPFPGWMQYGAFYNEQNNWWPYFKIYTDYKTRLSSVLQNVTYKADIAILNPIGDMWSTIGMQNEPFPSKTIVPYKTFVWEAISKCGGNSDYVTEDIIRLCKMDDGLLQYGKCLYKLLILTNIERISQDVAEKILRYAENGGRVMCIETIPYKSLGTDTGERSFAQADSLVRDCFRRLQAMDSTRFIFVHKPDSNYLDWYHNLLRQYRLPNTLNVSNPDPYVMQNHYVTEDGNDVFFLANANRYDAVDLKIDLDSALFFSCEPEQWDLETGTRKPLGWACTDISSKQVMLTLKPAQSVLWVFKKTDHPQVYTSARGCKPFSEQQDLSTDWLVEFRHSLLDSSWTSKMDTLKDLNKIDGLKTFTGKLIYKKNVNLRKVGRKDHYVLNPGLIEGVGEIYVNGHCLDTLWYCSTDLYMTPFLRKGDNEIEIHVVTTMGNYLKTWTNRPDVQHWVNRKGREQWWQPMGLIGPVKLWKQ